MFNKKVKAMLFIFLILFCVAAVNAAEIDNSADVESVNIVDVKSDSYIAAIDEESNIGNFTELNEAINGNSNNYKNTIDLTKNYTYQDSDSKYKEGINITRNLTIDGHGYTIDGNHAARIFKVSTVSLTIKNINLINGNGSSYGGAIWTTGKLTLINSTFNNNTAGSGGAIYNDGNSNVNVTDSIFDYNTANRGSGGAISTYYANILLQNSEFNDNSAISGGAIYSYSGDIITSNSNFTKNTATSTGIANSYGGGAIHNYKGNLNVANSTFIQNTALNSWGGAIYVPSYSPSVNVFDSIFIQNSAYNGGAIAIEGNVSNCLFIQNTAGYYGGAITTDDMNLFRSIFINNSAEQHGGAIIIGRGNITESEFFENNATDGGAIYIAYGNVTIDKSNLIKNNASRGGAIYFTNNYFEELLHVSITIMNNNFEENYGCYGDDIFTGYYTNVFNNTYTKNSYANIYANDTIINCTIVSVLKNSTYYVIANSTFKVYAVVLADGASVEGYNITIVDKEYGNKYSTTYIGNGIYESAVNIIANFTLKEYTAILNHTTNRSSYIIKDGIVSTEKQNINIEIELDDTVYGENIAGNITLTDDEGNIANVTSEITIEIDGKNYTTNVTNGTGSFVIEDQLNAGNYTLNASFDGDEEYTPSTSTVDFEIGKADPNLDVNVTDIEGNLTMDIIMNPDINGNVTVIIDNETIIVEIKDGKGQLNLDNIESGNHEFTVEFEGNNNYNPATTTGDFNTNNGIVLEVEYLTKYYGSDKKLNVRLRDANGNPLANKTITIKINGVTYTRTTDENGQILMSINLIPGVYETEVSYENMTETVNVTVLSTIQAEDLIKYFKNGSQYYAKFLDVDGTPLANTNVTFNIHGVFYTRTTDANGIAKLNINLNPGEYIITAWNPVNTESKSNLITVLSTIFGENVIKYYRNGTQYYAYVLDTNGNPLANANVTFNIHGVFYNRTSNEEGIVKLNINLNPGEYIITAWNLWNGEAKSNNITVYTVVKSQDLEMTTQARKPFKVTILGEQGKPLANAKVSFNIHGVFYYKTTDANGQVSLDINLIAGKYIITTYYNGYAVSNTIVVK